MTLCPIAVVASCSKCPVVGICPLKSVIGDYVKEAAAKPKSAPSAGARTTKRAR
jgi:hypothetical protein